MELSIEQLDKLLLRGRQPKLPGAAPSIKTGNFGGTDLHTHSSKRNNTMRMESRS
jgi:hypothetical protein